MNWRIWLPIVAGILIAAVGAGLLLRSSREAASLNGTWIARMQEDGKRPYNLRLRFETAGRNLAGEVEYPGGTAAIEGGTVDDAGLAFFTKNGNGPATVTFSGEIRGREVELTATTPDGRVARGTARKTN